MKRIVSLLCALATTLFLSGCGMTPVISERVIVEAMGIDWADGIYTVILMTYKPQSDTAQTDSKPEIYTGSGESLTSAIGEASSASGREPFFDNNRLLLLGRNAACRKTPEIVSYMLGNPEMNTGSYAVVLDEEATFALNRVEGSDSLSEPYLSAVLKRARKAGAAEDITVLDLFRDIKDDCRDASVPLMMISDDGIAEIAGAYCFSGAGEGLTLTPEETQFLGLMTGAGGHPSFNLDIGESTACVTVIDCSLHIKTLFEQERAVVSVKVSVSVPESFSSAADSLCLATQKLLLEGCLSVITQLDTAGSDVLCLAAYFRRSCAVNFIKSGINPRDLSDRCLKTVSVTVTLAPGNN